MKQKKIAVILLSSSLALGLGSLISVQLSHASSLTPDESAIENVISQALNSEYQMPVLSDATYASLTTLTSSPTESATANTHVQSAIDKRNEIESQLYSGNPLTLKQEQVQLAFKAQKNGKTRGLGGGVGNITYNQLNVEGDTAQVIAVADVWSKFEQKSPSGGWNVYEPNNKLIINETLTKDSSGTWKITQEQWGFVPGYGP